MKTNAAVLWVSTSPGASRKSNSIHPPSGEVLVSLEATGLCHSDQHFRTGDCPGAASVDRRPRGRRHRAGGRAGRTRPRAGRPCRGVVPSGVRPLPLVLDGPSEPVRHGRVIHGRHSGRRHLPAACTGPGVGHRMVARGPSRQYGTVPENSLIKIDEDLPLNAGVPAGLRGHHRVGLGGQHRRSTPRRHRRGDRLRRHRQRRASRARGWPARRRSSPSTSWKPSATRLSSSAPPTSSRRCPRPPPWSPS